MAAKEPRAVVFLVEKPIAFAHRAVKGAAPKLADLMQHELKKVLNTPYPPVSRPFTPPHKRTGYLRSHTEVKGTPVAPAGTVKIVVRGPKYGIDYLEQGTPKMDPRPYIKPTIFDRMSMWNREFTRILRSLVR